MDQYFNRRSFLMSLMSIPVFMAKAGSLLPTGLASDGRVTLKANRLRTSLNAFSFNGPLTSGTMVIEDMIAFCADTGFEAVDITGYYFKGYPVVPSDEYIYRIKRKAFALGVEISGTGVRNDLTV